MKKKGILATALFLFIMMFSMGASAQTDQQIPAEDMLRSFRAAMIGLVVGDAKAVITNTTTAFVKDIVDSNRETFVKFKDNKDQRAHFEKLTGRPYNDLLTLPDKDLAVVVIDKLIPLLRTEQEKQGLVTTMNQAKLLGKKRAGNSVVITIGYADSSRDEATFIMEAGSWRLNKIAE